MLCTNYIIHTLWQPMLFLITGLRFIPLRKPGGDPISHSGIFVEIKLSLEQPGSNGLRRYSLEVPNPPTLFNAQQMNESEDAQN